MVIALWRLSRAARRHQLRVAGYVYGGDGASDIYTSSHQIGDEKSIAKI